jgi:hypothetical protein
VVLGIGFVKFIAKGLTLFELFVNIKTNNPSLTVAREKKSGKPCE